MLLAFHKPFGILSQFTTTPSRHGTLSQFSFPPRVYPIGRLDADSEGLLLLSDEAAWNQRLLHPARNHPRIYWAQVERVPSLESLQRLSHGIMLQGKKTLPCRAWILDPQPEVAPRQPPIRFRINVPDCWIALELVEGRNRQVRHMTAAIGHPTLRLIRVQIGQLQLANLQPGQWKPLNEEEQKQAMSAQPSRATPEGMSISAQS